MPVLPAICPNGHIFKSSFFIENAHNISLSGIKSQCPYCGSMGSIPDGLYDFIDGTVKFLGAPTVSISSLRKLKVILEDARENKDNFSTLSEKLNRETPELSSLSDIIPKNRNELYGFIGLILMILTLIQNQYLNDKDPNEIINIINYNQVNNYSIPPINKTVERPIKDILKEKKVPKVRRNDLCHCNSGKKYKLCHGK
ncbi:SEC-C metal-binding domain-containing protein [Persicitalea sp.]|uniref:SEC-C metal-binding domain-containing protein n=1 Tax=Persicitalea sp. TaxID=3100273 RepID=UPI0035935991